ncbi:hypothetical protein [Saccharopolyspora flava]|uniref:Uncharacterized protein n=1 Tax=Saccharopolyspora flava TaxID=95161 RepID=A0A1I6V683_9PSEU|nr:hypothetical protein [Saccharopolyspora flava]SFT09140.1 hypothetical protein SAMN05660874_05634 [Saccharopolyspora flava]
MSSLLIVFIGMSVPILAAAPFYIADRRSETRPEKAESEKAELGPEITEAPRIWPDPVEEPACEIPEARTPEEALPSADTASDDTAPADTAHAETERVAQP